jgi:hypothetical protein
LNRPQQTYYVDGQWFTREKLLEHLANDQPAQKPSIGRVVHYVSGHTGDHYAAMITKVDPDGKVSLVIWPPNQPYIGDRAVEYSEECAPRTWHWPERV